MAQWLRIRLPMQGTRVRSLVWEDPTCYGATKPVHHNYWAHVLQLLKPVLSNKRSHHTESLRTATKSSSRSLQLEKAHAQQWRPTQPKKKITFGTSCLSSGWLHVSNAGGEGWIPGQGTKIPPAAQCGQNNNNNNVVCQLYLIKKKNLKIKESLFTFTLGFISILII